MAPRVVTIILAAFVALVAGAGVYWSELHAIKASAADTLDVRANLIRQYVRLMRHNVYALEHGIEAHAARVERSGGASPLLDAVREYPDYGIWGISGLASEGGVARLSGTLSGFDSLQSPRPEVRRELSAVLANDFQFVTLLEDVPDIIWVYYTSKNDFIYIAPDPAIADFRFSEMLHTKEFWVQAIPEHNPEMRQIISDLYEDAYGQGLMISISSPVVIDGEFTGVASLDLGIDLLRELTDIGQAAGRSILVDENDRIVARLGDFELDESYPIPSAGSAWMTGDGDTLWQSRVVAQDELRLLHRLRATELYVAAVWASVPFWVVLAAMFGLAVFSIRLNQALARVRTLMHRDMLTGLLNRRGFAEAVKQPRAEAVRSARATALLLLDIDQFKQINDTHGHETGDRVLVELAERLCAGVKEFDRVSRWGGEELLLFLVYDEPLDLEGIAERLRRNVEERPFSEQALRITISGGVTDWPAEEALEKAVDRADQRLYDAKAAGRNRIVSDRQPPRGDRGSH